jgi:hypothetical protein
MQLPKESQLPKPAPQKDTKTPPPTFWDRARGKVVGITGVLLVLPALVNAGYDIYASVAKLPRTDKEKVNVEMFEKYFKKAPREKLIVPIQSGYGTVEATFHIFEEGDIFVEFGRHTQWFKFPRSEPPVKVNWLPFISSAFAGEVSTSATVTLNPPSIDGAASRLSITNSSMKSGAVIRSQANLSGSVVLDRIDIRTGNILSSETREAGSVKIGTGDLTTTVRRLGVISVIR